MTIMQNHNTNHGCIPCIHWVNAQCELNLGHSGQAGKYCHQYKEQHPIQGSIHEDKKEI